MKSLLPRYIDGKIVPGCYIQCSEHCLKNPMRSKCKCFYDSLIKNGKGGFFTCPFGFSSYMFFNNAGYMLFTGFRDRETYQKSKNIKIQTDAKYYNPVLNREQINNLIEHSIYEQTESIAAKEEAIKSLFHEVKKLNAQIKEYCDNLLNYTDFEQEKEKIVSCLYTIYVCSSMINTRYSFYEYEKNPDCFSIGDPYNSGVYKKFDKIRRILQNYNKKGILIHILGNSFKEYEMYQSFEMIPLLLIENAVKYSLKGRDVEINFEHFDLDNIVTIESFSYFTPQQEIERLFDRGYRGENTKNEDGSGLGLFFVKRICSIHNIKITITSDKSRIANVNGIEYAPFIVKLIFKER